MGRPQRKYLTLTELGPAQHTCSSSILNTGDTFLNWSLKALSCQVLITPQLPLKSVAPKEQSTTRAFNMMDVIVADTLVMEPGTFRAATA